MVLDGEVSQLNGAIYRDDRKPLARWFTGSSATREQKPNTC